MSICWNRFADIVRNHRRFLLTSHIRPDCDALGSELALALMLEGLGKQVRIVNGHATPPNLAFLDPQHRIQTLGVDVQAESLRDYEVLIVLDTSAGCNWARWPTWSALGRLPSWLSTTTSAQTS